MNIIKNEYQYIINKYILNIKNKHYMWGGKLRILKLRYIIIIK